ncbi:hypothetical protein AAFF_G00390240 [Aldrovandia affinis]|uniref:Uncharacterized protein n=1 Tax=Aldrovandia affinis TaxID=143900 RepID=A0AAD7WLA3_9TELE|nr:hypothetical protein AAFF_G00390240 [Aldrovandia affinis]
MFEFWREQTAPLMEFSHLCVVLTSDLPVREVKSRPGGLGWSVPQGEAPETLASSSSRGPRAAAGHGVSRRPFALTAERRSIGTVNSCQYTASAGEQTAWAGPIKPRCSALTRNVTPSPTPATLRPF